MKKSSYLISYCKGQVGRPYWCGTFGQYATPELLAYNKKRLPAIYHANDYVSQLGSKVHDCCGLIKGAMWCKSVNASPVYVASQDLTVRGFYDASKIRGAISPTLVLRPGTLLFRGNFQHVGVYVGNNTVVHAKGHAYGVISERYNCFEWTHYCESSFFDYGSTPDIMVGDRVRLKKGAYVYGTTVPFASFVYDNILYVRALDGDRAVISIYPIGAITGACYKSDLERV